jgi:hypothetical protein
MGLNAFGYWSGRNSHVLEVITCKPMVYGEKEGVAGVVPDGTGDISIAYVLRSYYC